MAASSCLVLLALVASAAALKSSHRSKLLGRESSQDVTSLKARFPYAKQAGLSALFQHSQTTRTGLLGSTARLFQQVHGDDDDDTHWSVAYEETAQEPEVPMTSGEATRAKNWFVAFIVSTALLTGAVVMITTKCLGLPSDAQEDTPSSSDGARLSYIRYVRGLPIYNIALPVAGCFISLMVYMNVIGAIRLQNKMILRPDILRSAPGYASNIYYDRISNFGERAFFASFSLVLQGCLGVLGLMMLRKYCNVQMTSAMVLKYVCRGAAAGIVVTMLTEFIHLPFQDNLKNTEDIVSRIILVLFVVGAIVLAEEGAKLTSLVLGLRREMPAPDEPIRGIINQETGPMRYLAAVLEAPRALAIAGLASGLGFAFVANIPRLLSVAIEPPLVQVSESSWGGETEQVYITEAEQRSVRIFTVLFWVLLNMNPFLSGIVAIKVAENTGGAKILTPKALVEILKIAVTIHFLHDLLSRSTSSWVTFLAFCTVPYSMNLFRKMWLECENDSQAQGLLEEREDGVEA